MPSFSPIAISLLSVLLLGTGALHSCTSGKQQRVISGQERRIAELTAERAALARSLHIFETAQSVESAVLGAVSRKQEAAQVRARHLESQLKETIRREKTIDFPSVLARDVSDAFCLRWLEAAGYAAADTDAA